MIKSKIKMIIHTQNGILSFEKALKSEAGWANKFSDVGRLVAVGVGVTVVLEFRGRYRWYRMIKQKELRGWYFQKLMQLMRLLGLAPKKPTRHCYPLNCHPR